MKKKQTIECEFCGKTIYNEPIVIKVEGALLNVCTACRQFGKEVERPKQPAARATPVRKKSTPQKVRTAPRKFSKPQKTQKSLVDNYAEIVRNARNRKKLTQMQLAKQTGISHSLIASIETGKITPTDSDVKKLERELSISLMEDSEIDPEFFSTSGSKKTTIGDIINIERR